MSKFIKVKPLQVISQFHFACPYCGKSWQVHNGDTRRAGFVKAAAGKHVYPCLEEQLAKKGLAIGVYDSPEKGYQLITLKEKEDRENYFNDLFSKY